MPVGKLRESRIGIKRADCIIVTKCPDNLNEAAAVKKANSRSSKSGNKTTTNILDSSGKINPPSFQGKSSYN